MKINYLIAYDIREPKRLNRIHYYISKKATALQKSVFLITANQKDITTITADLLDRAKTDTDDIRLYPIHKLDNIWTAGKQAEKLSGLYSSFSTQPKSSLGSRLVARLFGVK